MSECHRLADQMRLAYNGDAWFGPSLTSLLDEIPAARAFEHPVEIDAPGWVADRQKQLAIETIEGNRVFVKRFADFLLGDPGRHGA